METVKGHFGSITFDGKTVVLDKKLTGTTRIPVGSIQAVSIERAGFGMKGVRFSVAGGTVASSHTTPGGKHSDLAKDPYAITFRSKALPEFEGLIGKIEAARG